MGSIEQDQISSHRGKGLVSVVAISLAIWALLAIALQSFI
jgi:hypothetical protein